MKEPGVPQHQQGQARLTMSFGQYRVPTTLSEVRDYVTGEGAAQTASPDAAIVRVTHSNLKAVFPELRLSRAMTIAEVKDKLYTHVGTRPGHMTVFLNRASDRGTAPIGLTDESKLLGFYSPAQHGDTLHVVDDDPFSASKGGWLEDTSLIQKYQISDEDYAKRPNTYAKYKEEMRKKDPNWTMERALARARGEPIADGGNTSMKGQGSEQPKICIGDRAEVVPGGKRGEVKFLGKDLEHLPPGWWVGVLYDEPVGKNDGVVKGIRYFEAPKNHGALVRPENLTVGDFPPLDDFSDDDEI